MKHAIRFAAAGVLLAGAAVAAEPRIEDVTFASGGTTLAGSIVWPAVAPPVAAVVFVHGSGPQTRDLGLARRFAAQGIAALVYDKRGVGRSGGIYEGQQSVTGMNIARLADDAAAALDTLADRVSPGGVDVGFAGISQAGWIVPLAATKTPRARFLLLWSAPVCKVSEEDVYSKHTGDVDGPRRPTYATALAARREPYVWPRFLGRDTDAAEDLAALSIPGLWIFGGNDGSIPVDLSRRNLSRLRADGHRYDEQFVRGQGHDNLAATFDGAIAWVHALAGRTTSAQVAYLSIGDLPSPRVEEGGRRSSPVSGEDRHMDVPTDRGAGKAKPHDGAGLARRIAR
jgi:pimeloyl-ACP methyl ester carboxylesterase